MKIIPVIHHIDLDLTLEQAEIISKTKSFGIFLISMTGENEDLPMLGKVIRSRYHHLKIGTNLLGLNALESLERNLEFQLDMTWCDNPIVTSTNISDEAKEISNLIKNKPHLFFNSVAFKYQAEEPNPSKAATNSESLGFIPTTSGSATGKAAEVLKIEEMAKALQHKCLGLASGITPQNVQAYSLFVEYGLVSTGISKNFHEVDPYKLQQLLNNSSV